MRGDSRHNQAGFSLVEIMVVMVIMGLVMTSVYSLFLNSQKSSITSEEVVDVQQNLRIAYDMMARDLRMAGFANPQSVIAATGSSIEVSSASPFNTFARILWVEADIGTVGDEDITEIDTTSAIPASFYFFVPAGQVQLLRTGQVFHICRPQNGKYIPEDVNAADTYFEAVANPKLVKGVNPPGTAPPRLPNGDYWYIELALVTTGATGTFNFNVDPNGDMLARVYNGYYPYDGGHVVAYELDSAIDAADGPNMSYLMRRIRKADGTDVLADEALATKIHDKDDAVDSTDGLRFAYMMSDGVLCSPDPTETVADCGGPPYTADDIVSVQVRITGSTDSAMTGSERYSGQKKRQILGWVHIKNRTVAAGS